MQKTLFLDAGIFPQPDTKKTPEGIRDRVLMMLMAFFMALLTIFRSLAGRVTKKLTYASSNELNVTDVTLDPVPQESRPPSPLPAFAEADFMPNVLKRLTVLEEKVDTLQSKPSEMPYEKEELLNAAVCRVDALEAELIATKKVYHLHSSFIAGIIICCFLVILDFAIFCEQLYFWLCYHHIFPNVMSFDRQCFYLLFISSMPSCWEIMQHNAVTKS